MIPENLILLCTDRYTRINDRLHIARHDLITLMSSVGSDHSFKNFKEVCKTSNDRWPGPPDLAQQAFLHVVTETVFDYPTVFISEKSIRPILFKRPFVLASSVGCLANIRKVGFQTFNQYWDESYDLIQDPAERMLAIIKIIDSICAKSIAELQELCVDMQDILDYNFNYYKTEFKKNELEKFDSECRKNLGIR
jgi:hypothetical protein